LKQHLQQRRVVYLGMDPTNRALHVGHLIPLMCLFHFHVRGHRVIPLIGGATARIGDPSGRSSERPQLDTTVVEYNGRKLSSAVSAFFEAALRYAGKRLRPSKKQYQDPTALNNIEWHQKLTLLDFLKTAGYHSRVNTMISRESVKARLDSQTGISFTEFTYQLLQAYDFYELKNRENCSIQIGGSDQWGNILAGVDLVNRMTELDKDASDKAFGITTPLLITSSGQKFSKSAGNAIWLNKSMTSYLDFYQFFLRTPDDKVGNWLKFFTLIPVEDIDNLMERHMDAPHVRIAQKTLAEEVTELIHGPTAVKHAKGATKFLFDSDYSSIHIPDIVRALDGDPKLHVLNETDMLTTPIIKLGVALKLFTSISYAKTLVSAKGLKVNNMLVQDPLYIIPREQLLGGRVAIVKAGPHKHWVLIIK